MNIGRFRYNSSMLETIILIVALLCLALLLWLLRQLNGKQDKAILPALEEKHRAMLLDLNDGLNKLGDRLNAASNESLKTFLL